MTTKPFQTNRKKITKTEEAKMNAPETPIVPFRRATNPLLYVVVFATIGLVCIVAILFLRPEADIVVVIGVVGGLITSIIFAFLGYIRAEDALEVSKQTYAQSKETLSVVNSRMTQSLATAIKAAMEEGRRLGRLEAEKRTDKLARQAKPQPRKKSMAGA